MNYKDLGYDEFLSAQPNLPSFLSTGSLSNLEGLDASQIVTWGRMTSPDGNFFIDFSTGEMSFPSQSVKTTSINFNTRKFKAVVSVTGGGDFTDIQEAIDYVNRQGGGAIYIAEGTHLPKHAIKLYNEIQLYGAGMHKTIIDFKNASEGDMGFYNDYTLTDISTVATDANHAINNIHICDMKIVETSGDYLRPDEGLLNFVAVRNLLIRNNYFYNLLAGDTVTDSCGIINTSTCFNTLIEKNSFNGDSQDSFGIFISGGHTIIRENIFANINIFCSIRITPGGNYSFNIIENNFFDLSNVVVSAIELYHVATEDYSNTIIKNNRIYSNKNGDRGAISINSSGKGIQRVIVDGNIISGENGYTVRRGICTWMEDSTTAKYITICNNIISKQSVGIFLDYLEKASVVGNIIDTCTTGLYIENTCDRIVYTGNYLYGATTPVTDNGTNSVVGHNVVA